MHVVYIHVYKYFLSTSYLCPLQTSYNPNILPLLSERNHSQKYELPTPNNPPRTPPPHSLLSHLHPPNNLPSPPHLTHKTPLLVLLQKRLVQLFLVPIRQRSPHQRRYHRLSPDSLTCLWHNPRYRPRKWGMGIPLRFHCKPHH
jgi:hypothetical protein